MTTTPTREAVHLQECIDDAHVLGRDWYNGMADPLYALPALVIWGYRTTGESARMVTEEIDRAQVTDDDYTYDEEDGDPFITAGQLADALEPIESAISDHHSTLLEHNDVDEWDYDVLQSTATFAWGLFQIMGFTNVKANVEHGWSRGPRITVTFDRLY